MKKWKGRARGAISIFLIIILLSNYALIGVLVDSARHRMARANAEMALDTAASSVLSYYNQMLYDLYGLFATDSLSNEQIQKLLTDYTSKTLGITEIEPGEATKLTQAVVNAIPFFEKNTIDGTPFDGYNYQIDISVDDTLPSLANTEMVEEQIIDHMKYKAPMTIVGEGTDFISKLQTILQIGDRIKQTIKKVSETNDTKKNLAEESDSIIKDIQKYNNKLLCFAATGCELKGSRLNLEYTELKKEYHSAYNTWDTIDALDQSFRNVINNYVWPEEEIDDDGNPIPIDEAAVEEELQSLLNEKYDAFVEDWKRVGENAAILCGEANDIYTRVEAIYKSYNDYIDQLQKKIDAEPDNENTKTLYAPEIELAKTTCGEVLKNMNLVLAGRQYLLDISNAYKSNNQNYSGISQFFADGAASAVIDAYMGRQAHEYATSLRKYISSDVEPFGAEANAQLKTLQKDFDELYRYAAVEYEEPKEVKLETTPEKVASSEEGEKDEKKEELADLNKEDLKVQFEQNAVQEWECNLEDEMGTENTLALLNAALNILNSIADSLEDARDSLYVNEYILAYFPNYVQHYKATDKDIAKNASNKKLISGDSYYKPYNATLAEVEYVLSGNPDSSLSVLSVEAKITAIRMAFNTVAIFTDAGKAAQANSLALAISGPFAPVIAPLLMIAWALAESVLDTAKIMDGESVLVFKQGTNWAFSIEGGIKEVIKKSVAVASDKVADEVNKRVRNGAVLLKSAGNKAVYEAFEAASSGVEAAEKKAKDTLASWGDNLRQCAESADSELSQDAKNAANRILQEQTNSMGSAFTSGLSDKLDNGKDKALALVNTGVTNLQNKITSAVDGASEKAAYEVAEWAGNSLSQYFDVGTLKNSGDGNKGGVYGIEMDYMDYIRLFLLFYNNETKVQRVQQLIQANLRHSYRETCKTKGTDVDTNKLFKLQDSHTSVSAKLTGSINFLFMSSPVLPEGLKKDGRLRFSVSTSLSY